MHPSPAPAGAPRDTVVEPITATPSAGSSPTPTRLNALVQQASSLTIEAPILTVYRAGTRIDSLHVPHNVFQFEYAHPEYGKVIVTTAADPDRGGTQYSLGGHRRVTRLLVDEFRDRGEEYTAEFDGLRLTLGMGDKIETMIRAGTAGALGLQAYREQQLFGGKIVFHSSPAGFQQGEREWEALAWAGRCVGHFAELTGIRPITGQDLAQTKDSLLLLHQLYPGSVCADTSLPTAWGNFHLLVGVAAEIGVDLRTAVIGLIGGGKIGTHLAEFLYEFGATRILVQDPSAEVRTRLAALARAVPHDPDLNPIDPRLCDVICPNAIAETLDSHRVAAIIDPESQCRIVAGCENNLFPSTQRDRSIERLLGAGRYFIDSPIVGHLGGAWALETALADFAGTTADLDSFLEDVSDPMRRLGRNRARTLRAEFAP